MLTDKTDGRKSGLKQFAEWETLVNSLDADQLHLLNEMICTRIDYLQSSEISREMANFRPGDHVSFVDKKGSKVLGRVFKLNRKTVGIIGDSGGKWNVSPGLLTHLEPAAKSADVAVLPTAVSNKVAPEKNWVFSILSMPGTLKLDDRYIVPEVAVWMDGNGLLRHISPLEPDEDSKQILVSFEQAQSAPAAGPACVPVQVRTDQSDIIALLRSHYPDIEFREGEVPEMTEVAEEMRKSFTTDDIPTYMDCGISPACAAAFFDATSQLYKLAPWSILPSELCLIDVSIEALGIKNSVVSVIGQQGLNFGVLLYDSTADHLLYSAIVSSGPEHFGRLPHHSALAFEKGDAIAPAQRKEFMEHGWQVASPDAYPELFLPVEDGIARHPTTDDLLLFEALSRGLTALLANRKELKASWNTGKPFQSSHRVSVFDQELDISFNLPATPDNKPVEALNALEEMALIDRLNLHDPSDRHARLVKEITARFEASKEFRALKECNGSHTLLMELGFNYLELTVASCLPFDLEEVLYELIPRKVMIGPDEAGGVIEDFVAFYQFLKREYGHPIADECLAVLGPAATNKLHDALSDGSKYGIGKSALTGNDFPFADNNLLPQTMLSPPNTIGDYGLGNPSSKPTTAQKKSRKKKRKTSQKSRKRNQR